jgi:hypothetical protein
MKEISRQDIYIAENHSADVILEISGIISPGEIRADW